MNILITGINGFVGGAVSTRLRAGGHSVLGAVRRFDPQRQLSYGYKQLIVGELGPDTIWEQALQGIDTVIHLAARVHMMNDTAADPLAAFRLVNVEATGRLALEASKAGVKRFVFISSVKVHGEETLTPYDETSPYNPQDPYGVSKMEAEKLLRRIEAETGLEVVVVRPTLVYGEGVKANFLRLIQMIQSGVPLPLASIVNIRSLLYVGNLADALAVCALHPKAAGQTYLVSDGEDVSTPRLIRSIAVAMGVPARLFPVPVVVIQLLGMLVGKTSMIQRVIGSLVVNSSKIRLDLGWKPPFQMKDGLRDTVEWYRSVHQ